MLFSLVKKSKIATLSAVCLALLLPGFASAEMIVNVQFAITGNTSSSMGGLAGPGGGGTTWNWVTGTNWNNVAAGPTALTLASGGVSGISLTMGGDRSRRANNVGGEAYGVIPSMIPGFGGGAFVDVWDGVGQTATFSGLQTDGTKYALYAMNSPGSWGDNRFTITVGNVGTTTSSAIRLRGSVFHLGGNNGSFDGTTTWTNWNFATVDASGDDPLFGSTANTAYFAELTPDASGNLAVSMNNANRHRWDDYSQIGVAGYQLVELVPVPEPNTVPLVGASIVGLLMLRRMRRK